MEGEGQISPCYLTVKKGGPMMTRPEFDWKLLVDSSRKDGAFRVIIDYLADRQRDPRNGETKVGNLADDLRDRGHLFINPLGVEAALKIFEQAGCGQFQHGRSKVDSRLNWNASAREIAKEVLERIKPEDRERIVESNGLNHSIKEREHSRPLADESSFETYFFPVRRGVMLEVKIRSDMTAKETKNLADFVGIIAASRANEFSDRSPISSGQKEV